MFEIEVEKIVNRVKRVTRYLEDTLSTNKNEQKLKVELQISHSKELLKKQSQTHKPKTKTIIGKKKRKHGHINRMTKDRKIE